VRKEIVKPLIISLLIRPKNPCYSPEFRAQKKASYLHRTATTTYPCCVPTLGDSAGAGRVGLASYKYTTF